MFKREAKVMLFILLSPIILGLVASLVGPRLLSSACKNSIIEEIPSPDKKYKIVIFTRDCGATTDYSTQVSLLSENDKLQNKVGNILIADTDHGKAPAGPGGGPLINASWENNDKIVLQYNKQARIFKAENKFNKNQLTKNRDDRY